MVDVREGEQRVGLPRCLRSEGGTTRRPATETRSRHEFFPSKMGSTGRRAQGPCLGAPQCTPGYDDEQEGGDGSNDARQANKATKKRWRGKCEGGDGCRRAESSRHSRGTQRLPRSQASPDSATSTRKPQMSGHAGGSSAAEERIEKWDRGQVSAQRSTCISNAAARPFSIGRNGGGGNHVCASPALSCFLSAMDRN